SPSLQVDSLPSEPPGKLSSFPPTDVGYFSLCDTPRSIKASTATAEQFFQKLRNKHEFTILVTLKQTHLNSGVILSIHHLDHRYV
ncbi:hypothetical protein FD754_006704, partial [Muntiacus muntjak]